MSMIHPSDNDKEVKKEDYDGLEPIRSVAEAEAHLSVDDTRNGQFHRSFSPRKVHASIAYSLQQVT